MPTAGTGPPPQPGPALLHRFLGIGLVILAAAMVIVRHAGGIAVSYTHLTLPTILRV